MYDNKLMYCFDYQSINKWRLIDLIIDPYKINSLGMCHDELPKSSVGHIKIKF
jgi:hypothetical protein